ncbi:MAG: hypothetical protein J4G05_05445 [Chlorobi bacterium]|nr:hypothetical protein [Chlorobiota bacterium]
MIQIDASDPIPGTTVSSDFYNNTYFALGLHGSLLSGIGVNGRALFPKGFVVQLTSFGYSVGGRTFFNVGGEGNMPSHKVMGGGSIRSLEQDITHDLGRFNKGGEQLCRSCASWPRVWIRMVHLTQLYIRYCRCLYLVYR